MEVDAESQLSRVLSTEELEKLPPDIVKKLEEYFITKFEEYITSKALCETAKRSIGKKCITFYSSFNILPIYWSYPLLFLLCILYIML